MKKILFLFPIIAICYGGGLALSYYMLCNFEGPFDIAMLSKSSYTIFPLILGVGGYLIYLLSSLGEEKQKPASKAGAKTIDGKEVSQYFDSRWITEKELRTISKYSFCNWNTVKNMKDGILLRCEYQKKNLAINMYKPIHTLIVGTTGTGKTKRYIEPTIQVLASTKTKPSFVIADPKGELYENQSHKLKSEGYDVKTFDLRNPFGSNRWNPLDNSFTLYQKAFSLYDNVKTHVGVNPADLKLKIIAREYNNEWYEYDGVAYPNKEMLDVDLESFKAQLIDKAENELREIASTLCPVQENATDKSWDMGAQEFIYGTMLAMLEDSLNPELEMTREKFNFYNLTKICNVKDADPNDPYKTLRQYYQGRDKFSKVPSLVSTAINNAPGTTKSYMGIVGGHLGTFNDSGMCYATSANEMNFDSFADRPTALFIIIPDEKIARHGIATMMISQLYSKLVDLANKYPKRELPRSVYFLLDEFANLPKIEKFDTMITVSRSRRIYFEIVIQAFSQLSAKYGEQVAQTIISNCPIRVFIGTDDAKTCEEFSKSCGDITLQTTSTSESSQKDEKGKDNKNKTTSVATASRPLIYPDELGHLKGANEATGEMIIKILNEYPIKVNSTMSWAIPIFDNKLTEQEYAPSRSLNEDEVAYNVARRNQLILNKNRPTFSSRNF